MIIIAVFLFRRKIDLSAEILRQSSNGIQAHPGLVSPILSLCCELLVVLLQAFLVAASFWKLCSRSMLARASPS